LAVFIGNRFKPYAEIFFSHRASGLVQQQGFSWRGVFVVEWLNINTEHEGYWDMGTKVKDGVRFPLSDSWRKKELRIKDCTYRNIKTYKKY